MFALFLWERLRLIWERFGKGLGKPLGLYALFPIIIYSFFCLLTLQQHKIFNTMAEELQQVADLITANTIFCTKEVLTSDEAARYLGVSKSCLYKWTMERTIPHYKPNGKMCYFNRKEIEAWLQSNRIATDDEINQRAQTYLKKGGKK